MLLQLVGFILDYTCTNLPTLIVHIDNYCYLYDSTLFNPFAALYYILHLSYTLKRGHFKNKPFTMLMTMTMTMRSLLNHNRVILCFQAIK